MQHRNGRVPRGVALIEALVALAVMAFGLLAVAGMQVTLRQNADLSRQRAEAVRIAQEEVERWRSYALLDEASGVTTVTYAHLQSGSETVATAVASHNTAYTLTRTVSPDSSVSAPAYKTLRVDVNWTDRNNQAQNVRLSTVIHGVAPELAATLSVPGAGNPTLQAMGRNAAIPLAALRIDASTSGFRPPQYDGGETVAWVAWVFNNVTGLFSTCTTSALTSSELTSSNIRDCTGTSQLLSGFVNFADATGPATVSQAISPTGRTMRVQVQVNRTLPSALTVGPGTGCFTERPSSSKAYLAYYCAVPVAGLLAADSTWSGSAVLTGLTGLAIERSACRYTRYRDNRVVSATSPVMTNADHPHDYSAVDGPLANQNFLVVGRYAGTDADCPDGLPGGSTTFPQP